MKTGVLLALAFAMASAGCGGVADGIASHRITLHVAHAGQPFAGAPLGVSIRTYSDIPFSQPQPISTDADGRASAEFRARWGSAFLIIPPIGSVPRHPPKPSYLVTTTNGSQFTVSPSTPQCQYRWRDGGWQTDARLDVP